MPAKGGARPGAGRPANSEKHAVVIEAAGDQMARSLSQVTEALIDLAVGRGFEEKWVPAGTLTRKAPLLRPPTIPPSYGTDGQVDEVYWLDAKGQPILIDLPLYPDLPANELVLVEQRPWKPDTRAAIEVNDRMLGKATQAVELGNGDNGPLLIQVVYSDADTPGDSPEAARRPEEDPPGDPAI